MSAAQTTVQNAENTAITMAWQRADLALGGYLVAIVGICYVSFASMADIWLHSSAYSHGILIAPIAGFFLFETRRAMTKAPRLWRPGFIAIALAASAVSFGRLIDAQIIQHVFAVALIAAGFITFYGLGFARRAAFPLAFLFFMVPFGSSLLPALQHIAANLSSGLLIAAGYDASLQGLTFTTSAGRFFVAEGCAGLNVILASIVTGALFSYAALSSWRDRAAFCALAVLVALLANGVRIFLFIAIAIETNGEWRGVDDHWLFGVGFYAAAIGALMIIGAFGGRRA